MLSTSEKSCIRNELGDELLESVLGQRAMSEGETQQWEVSTFGCLDPETAAGLFLSSLLAGMGEVSEEAEDCLRELVAESNVVELIASTSPDADPGSAAGALEFTLGLLACVPEQLLSGGSEPGAGPSPSTDESLLWSFHTGDWVVISPAVANGIVYAGSDDNHVYALPADPRGAPPTTSNPLRASTPRTSSAPTMLSYPSYSSPLRTGTPVSLAS